MPEYKLLKHTSQYMAGRVRLPVLKEEFFYPTEASVELDPEHPGESNVIGTCMRAAWYRYMGGFVGDPYSEYTHWIFLTGKAVEAALIENWKEMGIWVDNNIKFRSKEHHISGEIDVALRDPEDGSIYLAEAKTYYGYQASKDIMGNPKRGILGKPKDAHLLQTLIYLYLHQHVFTKAKLIYIDKTCKDNAEFNITLSQEGDRTYPVINGIVQRRFAAQDIFDRYKKLKQYVDTKELPPRDFELEYSEAKIKREALAGNIAKTPYEAHLKKGTPIGDWNCRYCRYSAECYGKDFADQDETVEE